MTDTSHGVEGEPQVFPALHSDAGSGSLQAYLLLFDWAEARNGASMRGSTKAARLVAIQFTFTFKFTFFLRRWYCPPRANLLQGFSLFLFLFQSMMLVSLQGFL